MIAGDYGFAVKFKEGEFNNLGAGGDDDIFGVKDLAIDFDLSWGDDFT